MSIWVILTILLLHFVMDYIVQLYLLGDDSKNKSSDNMALMRHVIIYAVPFALIFGPVYGVVNGVLHWVTDYYSSRKTKELWEKQDVKGFFSVLGLDQLLHMVALFATYPLLVN